MLEPTNYETDYSSSFNQHHKRCSKDRDKSELLLGKVLFSLGIV